MGERGLAQATAAGYAALVAPLADWLCAEGPDGRWDSLDARAVAGFVEERGTGWSPGSRGVLASAVRSLLGWARGRGLVAADLTGVVFSHAAPAGRLPARAGAADVGAMLGATPCDSSVGLRDRAVITVLHRLALRSGELARLGLDDVDWAAGRLRVVGKGRELTLPIPVDVGEALEAYLTAGRPKGALDRSVFTMARAPLRGLTVSAVNGITRAAGRRAGVGPVSPRQLRHGAATAVVNQGGSLAEAGQLLGHARPATTAIYARLDLPALRPLAREWGV
ncbi:MAG: tyrosine-type recombinase/integrase [Bifidobacteriaceae bacterium]|nr:tyrosine-type recombinase/integrase [Bifidobacteriaceae bacterium]